MVVIKKELIWIFVTLFFALICFVTVGSWNSFQPAIRIILFSYVFASTLLARYGYRKSDGNIGKNSWKIISLLLFIIFGYFYMFSIEFVANIQRIFTEPGFFMKHMTYHIFNNTLNILYSSTFAWLFFQKFKAGCLTFVLTFFAGMLFCFLSPNVLSSSGKVVSFGTKFMNSFFFIWVFHFIWGYVLIIFSEKYEVNRLDPKDPARMLPDEKNEV